MRAIWPLMKARVVEKTETYVKLHIGGSTTVTVTTDTRAYDIREGDLLTLYTEVLLAKPQGTS
jgi:hypothetical protein